MAAPRLSEAGSGLPYQAIIMRNTSCAKISRAIVLSLSGFCYAGDDPNTARIACCFFRHSLSFGRTSSRHPRRTAMPMYASAKAKANANSDA